MTVAPAEDHAVDARPAPAGVLRRNAKPLALIAAVTLAVPVGTCSIGVAAGAGPRACSLAAIWLTVTWCALACPMFAAGAGCGWSSFLRSGAVADASVLGLLAISAGGWFTRTQTLSAVDSLQVYVTLATLAVLAPAVVTLLSSPIRRLTAGLVVALVQAALLATPFWTDGLLSSAEPDAARRLADLSMAINPLYSVAAAVGISWNHTSMMYGITRLGEDIPVAGVEWYTFALWCGGLAGGLGVLHLLLRKRGRSHDPQAGPRSSESR